ncbi:MAG: YcxB family protein [Oscillospiraceae bacterium]|jgi:type II secretory pathway pseudopilin PulG|nr:YcxB family protein [Oscillospiraceae bacterium]
MVKKFTAALLSLLLCVTAAGTLPAAAASSVSTVSAVSQASAADGTPFELKDCYMKLNIPKGLYAFTQDTSPSDGNLMKAGIANWYTEKKDMQDRSSVLLVSAPLGRYTMSVGKKSSSSTQQYYNMTAMSDAGINSLISDLCKPQSTSSGSSVSTKAHRYTSPTKQPYIFMDMQGNTDNKKVKEVAYFTIINGSGYTFETYRENGELSAEQKTSLKQLVDSVKVTQVLAKPAGGESSVVLQSVFILLLPVLVIAAIILVMFLTNRARRARENKRKALLLERLTAYRKAQETREEDAREKGLPPPEPETLIENNTKCVKKTLHRFSWYDLLLNRKGTWITTLVIAVLAIAAAVWIDSTGVRVVALLIAAFGIIYPLTIPRKVFQAEDGSFRKMKSRRIRYQFRAEDFRVSGVYSGVYPYVQIIHVYEVKRYFYLYLGANHVYILNKHSFTQGTADDLRKLLQEKCLKL